MKISELIRELSRYKKKYGDVVLTVNRYPGDFKVYVIDGYEISAREANPQLPYDLIFEKPIDYGKQ